MPKRMNDERRQALLRAQALKDEGKSWGQVAEILAGEGVRTNKGTPYTAKSLGIMCSRIEKNQDVQIPTTPQTDKVDRLSVDKVDTTEPVTSDKVDRLAKGDIDRLMQRVENLIDQKIQAALGAGRDRASVPRDNPPKTPKEGKHYVGKKWKDLRCRVDENLWRLLDADCRSHYGGNMSRCMDSLLWRYFGQPSLSFEQPESEPEA